ncbi:MAG: tetratricopeptide repeat protein, partial [Nannocystaceae bacterium]|nr:tetratricopeptide repeat protein [Nannocystaceae bacterium]
PADTRAGALGNYGLLLATQEDYAGAIDHLEQALAIREGYQAPDHPEIARVLSNLGGALLANDELLRAKEVLSRAVGILERAQGGERSVMITVLAALGRAHLASGEPRTALPLLERAVALGDDSEADPITRGDAEFGLARALVDTGGSIGRARALATVARAHYARGQSEGQPGTESPLAALDQWRLDHPAP